MTDQREPRPDEERQAFAEAASSLWRITFPPLTWAAHFLACYGLVSLACVRGLFPLGTVRALLLVVSVAALVLIAWLGWRSWRKWSPTRERIARQPSGDAESRDAFLGHAGLLLAIVSFVAVAYVTLPVLLLAECR